MTEMFDELKRVLTPRTERFPWETGCAEPYRSIRVWRRSRH
jgi:hypothetical protein